MIPKMLFSTGILQDEIRRGGYIVYDNRSRQFRGSLALDLGAVASPNKDRALHAGIPAAYQINQLVADHVALLQVQAEFIPCVKEELRRGFASATGLIRRFWCDVDFFEAHTLAVQLRN